MVGIIQQVRVVLDEVKEQECLYMSRRAHVPGYDGKKPRNSTRKVIWLAPPPPPTPPFPLTRTQRLFYAKSWFNSPVTKTIVVRRL